MKGKFIMKYVYNDGGRMQAGFKGSSSDCVCRAIAIVTGKSYLEIYEALANGNASQRVTKKSKKNKKTANEGIYVGRKWFKDYMTSLGFVWIPTMGIGTGCKVHLSENELPLGKLIVSVSKHYTVVIDGVIHDIYNPQREENGVQKRCVYGYWKLN